MVLKIRKINEVIVFIIGDGGIVYGEFYEGLNFVVLFKVLVVVVI